MVKYILINCIEILFGWKPESFNEEYADEREMIGTQPKGISFKK